MARKPLAPKKTSGTSGQPQSFARPTRERGRKPLTLAQKKAKEREFEDFSERLLYRERADTAACQEAYADIAAGALGKKLSHALENNPEAARSALAQIANALHVKTVEIPDDITDINEQIDYLLEPEGVMRRSVDLTKGWYKNAIGVYLGSFKSSGSPVALVRRGGVYAFWDTTKTKFVRVTRKNEDLFDTEALCFYPPLALDGFTFKTMPLFILHSMPLSGILGAGAIALIGTLIGMLSPALTRIITGDAVGLGRSALLIGAGIFLVCVLIGQRFFTTMQSISVSRLTQEGEITIRASLMARVMALPASFFRKNSAGQLNYLTTNIERIWSETLNLASTSTLSFFASFIYIAQLFLYAPSLVVPSLIILGSMTALSTFQVVYGARSQFRIQEQTSKNAGTELETISGVRKIKLVGAEKRAFSRWGHNFGKVLQRQNRLPFLVKYGATLQGFLTSAGWILLYACASMSGVSTGDFYAFVATYGMVSGAFAAFPSIASSLASISSALKLLNPLLEEVPEISADRRPIRKIEGQITLSDVTFRYSKEQPYVFKNLSLMLNPGEYVALVGKTGVGKTTLLRLLLGFEQPETGVVAIDGHDISTIDARTLRRRIGIVMQNDKLFPGDIYSNIVISNPLATMDEAWEAAELACIADDIREMPMGMHTLMDDNGRGLSGGQIQRLTIARAIVSKPKILFLDEATSALDNATQQKISDNLAELNATRLVIAHRLSTIKKCDRVILLEDGKVVRDGTYEELKDELEA